MNVYLKGRILIGNKIYHAEVIAKKISPTVYKDEQYSKFEDELLDQTMSCTPEEALDYMEIAMVDAIMNGRGGGINLTARALFLAAYDIHKSILESGRK